MAEISLIASIVQIAGIGAKVSITLFQFASALGSAGYDVRFVAADISALSLVLTHLSDTLRGRKSTESEGEQIAGAVVLLCRSVVDDSQELLKHLDPLVNATGSASINAALRVRWIFEKSKFATHRQSLESLKSTLNLLVTTMSLAAAVETKAPVAVNESLQAQVNSLKIAVEANNQGNMGVIPSVLVNSKSLSETLEEISPFTIMRQDLTNLPTTTKGEESSTFSVTAEAGVSDSNLGGPGGGEHLGSSKDTSIITTAGRNIKGSTAITLYTRQVDEQDRLVHEDDEYTTGGFMALLEISLLQKRAVEFADRILEKPVERTQDPEPWTEWASTKTRTKEEQDFALEKLRIETNMKVAVREAEIKAEMEIKIREADCKSEMETKVRLEEMKNEVRSGLDSSEHSAERDAKQVEKHSHAKNGNVLKKLFRGLS